MRVRSLLGIATLLLFLHQPMWLQAAETNCMQLTDPSQADECFSNMRRKWQEADAQRRAEAKRRAAANNQTNCMELSDGNQLMGCFWNNIQKLKEENKRLQADVANLPSLQRKVDDLATENERLLTKINKLEKRTGVLVLSIDHAHGSLGEYFNFYISKVDSILGSANWHNNKFIIRNNRSGEQGQAVLFRGSNGGSIGDGHGRWDGKASNSNSSWKIGDLITIIRPVK